MILMRDKYRILPMCATLQSIWELYPDLRFGQLLYNFTDFVCKQTGQQDTFNIEDDVMQQLLAQYYEELVRDGSKAGNK